MLPWLVVGGAEQFALEMVRQLKSHGYEVSICTTMRSDHPWLARFAALTPDVFCLPAFLNMIDYPRFLCYIIESRQVDVVMVSNSLLGYQLLPLLRSRYPQTAFVDYNHAEVEHWQSGGHPRRSVGYHELLDLSIVASEHLRQWMIARGAEPERVEVCRVNVDTEVWNPERFDRALLRRQFGVGDKETVILFSGRLSPEKRPDLLIEIVSRLSKVSTGFVCLVAGDGPERSRLKESADNVGLGRQVRFLGTVDSERMQSLQALADILLLPSAWEGIAKVLYEGMAMETVPVASDVGGQAELVTPDCGFLIARVQETEVDEYVKALQYLIEHPDARRAMGCAGRRRILDDFTIEKMGQHMIHLLERACTLSAASPRPAVGKGLGLECAALALEYHRLERTVDSMWAGRSALGDRQPEAVLKELEAIQASRTWKWGHWIARSWPVQMSLGLVRRIARLFKFAI